MGRAYQPSQRAQVKDLLEAGRDEESIEKETGVSDRTIRRWKAELERTGRIGKPPESRTGRHRALTVEIENALLNHVRDKPDMSVDEMLWWLYDEYKLVVATRTIRRVFERKGQNGARFKKGRQSNVEPQQQQQQSDILEDVTSITEPEPSREQQYSPYVPIANMSQQANADLHLAQALQQHVYPPPPLSATSSAPPTLSLAPPPLLPESTTDLTEEEEVLKLELEKIALEKREVELKLKMKRLRSGKSPSTPTSAKKATTPTGPLSTLYKPGNNIPPPPKRDSRSKKKIEETNQRKDARQIKMLHDLERRSRRREHFTAEWVQSKDVWPVRAQAVLANLMHQYGYYTFNQTNIEPFQAMFQELYQLVDHSKGDWDPNIHDDLLRERMKRKMGQLRSKMQKTGEIIGRGDAFGNGWQRAEDFTGEQAGNMEDILGDKTENDIQHDHLQAQSGALPTTQHEEMHYEPVPDTQQLQHGQLPYGTAPMLHHQQSSQYPIMDGHGMLPYGTMAGQQGLVHQDSIGL